MESINLVVTTTKNKCDFEKQGAETPGGKEERVCRERRKGGQYTNEVTVSDGPDLPVPS